MAKKVASNDANLGFEAKLFAAADKLRGNMEPSDYKHVALGLIFLKYISDAFEAKRAELLEEELADAEDPEEYLAENVFWVPRDARWSHLHKARRSTIGKVTERCFVLIPAAVSGKIETRNGETVQNTQSPIELRKRVLP